MFVTPIFFAITTLLGVASEPPLRQPLALTEIVAPDSIELLKPATPHLLLIEDLKEVSIAKPSTDTYCSCVLYVQSLGGKVKGNAINVKPTHFTPSKGDVAIMRYPGNVGHVAMVTEVEDGGFWITEANYHSCKKTERFIRKDYRRLVGFTR